MNVSTVGRSKSFGTSEILLDKVRCGLSVLNKANQKRR